MKKLLSIFLLFIAFIGLSLSKADAQVKISDMTTYSGNPAGGWVPVVIGGQNYKVNAKNFGGSDSISVSQGPSYDTLWMWKLGVKAYYKLIRYGGGGTTLPSQSGNDNKFLTTSGGSLSWANVKKVYDNFGDSILYAPANAQTKLIADSSTITIYDGTGMYFDIHEGGQTGQIQLHPSSIDVSLNNKVFAIKADNLTSNRTYQERDRSGTRALMEDIADTSAVLRDIINASSDVSIYNSDGRYTGIRTYSGGGTGFLNIDSIAAFQLNSTTAQNFIATPDYFNIKAEQSSPSKYATVFGNLSAGMGSNVKVSTRGASALRLDSNFVIQPLDSSLTNKKFNYSGNIHSTFTAYSLIDKSYGDSAYRIDTFALSTRANRDKMKDSLLNKIIYPKQSVLTSSILGFGDSFTETSMNASPSDSGYINRLKAYTGGTLTNLAAGGRGVWIMTYNAYANINPGNTKIITALSGLNDYRRSGYNTKTNNKVYNSYLALMVNQFARKFVNGCSPEITRSAGWTGAYQGQAVGMKFGPATSPTIPNGTHAIFNGTPLSGTADSLQWTFVGNNVVSAFAGVDNVTYTGYGTFEIYVDGVLKATGDCKNQWDGISDGTYDNGRGTYVVPVFGLTEGTHTVKVKIFGNGYVPFDYFAVLEDPKKVYPVYIGDIPHLDATGYATSPANATDAIVDSGSRVIRSAINLFSAQGYPAYAVTTNVYYQLASGLDPADHIHPNNTGHRQIYNAFKAVLDSNSTIAPPAFSTATFTKYGWCALATTPSGWGGTPPSGVANNTYRITRLADDVVMFNATLNYASAGTSNTGVTITLPADAPTPSFPKSQQIASTTGFVGIGYLRTGGTATNVRMDVALRLNSGGTGYEIVCTGASATNAKEATIQIQYFTGQ